MLLGVVFLCSKCRNLKRTPEITYFVFNFHHHHHRSPHRARMWVIILLFSFPFCFAARPQQLPTRFQQSNNNKGKNHSLRRSTNLTHRSTKSAFSVFERLITINWISLSNKQYISAIVGATIVTARSPLAAEASASSSSSF